MSITRHPDDSAETHRLLDAAAVGDRLALSRLLARHQPHLLRFAASRLDERIRSRVDPGDVVQETHAEVIARFEDYLRRRPTSFRAWVLKTAYDHLGKLMRRHLHAEGRSVLREVHLDDDSSLALAGQLMASQQPAWAGLELRDLAAKVRGAIDRLNDADREVLLLRYVDDLDNQEIGYLLNLEPGTVSKRCGRALLRLHRALAARESGDIRP